MLGSLIGGKSNVSGYPLRERFRAWWEGYDLPPPALSDVPPPPPRVKEPEGPVTPRWTEERIAFTQTLFGEGMIGPFDEELARQMIDPLGLNEKLSVVEIGSRLGGFARWTAKHTGAYVTAFEHEADLARIAQELSTKQGLAKKARIVHEAADAYDVRARTVDAVISKEGLFTYPEKARLLQAVRKSLKPGAQISITDYLLEGDAMSPDILVWAAHEPTAPHLITAAEYRAQLERNELEVSILEDITTPYVSSVLARFDAFARSLRTAPAEDVRRSLGLAEGEFWGRRLRVMEQSLLRVYRIYARLPAVR